MICSTFAELAPAAIADETRTILTACEQNLNNDIELPYDQYNPFDMCCITYEPIYKGSLKATCPYCQASYQPELARKWCTICNLAQIDSSATGLGVLVYS